MEAQQTKFELLQVDADSDRGKEEWRDIEGYEGLYQVSEGGNVRSLDRLVKGSYNSKGKCLRKGRVLAKCTSRGYVIVILCNSGVNSTRQVHRLVAEAFIPNPNNFPFVLHGDDNPINNCISNLRWGTHQDNVNDMFERGRSNKATGSNHGNSILSEKDVLEIRKLLLLSRDVRGSQESIGRKFNVSGSVISNIKSKKTWRHI